MPIPFDDLSAEDTQTVRVAWLRFVEEEHGEGIRATLFQTSGEGEALGFCFTRIGRRGFPGRWARINALSYLAKALFRTAVSLPTLILALADEVPAKVLAGDIRLRAPTCRIGTTRPLALTDSKHGDPASNPYELLWATEQPSGESAAYRFLQGIEALPSPLEPFDRAAKALRRSSSHEQHALRRDQAQSTALTAAEVDTRPSRSNRSAASRSRSNNGAID